MLPASNRSFEHCKQMGPIILVDTSRHKSCFETRDPEWSLLLRRNIYFLLFNYVCICRYTQITKYNSHDKILLSLIHLRMYFASTKYHFSNTINCVREMIYYFIYTMEMILQNTYLWLIVLLKIILSLSLYA